jgi:uncharacterized protein YcbK (DUF882 family)
LISLKSLPFQSLARQTGQPTLRPSAIFCRFHDCLSAAANQRLGERFSYVINTLHLGKKVARKLLLQGGDDEPGTTVGMTEKTKLGVTRRGLLGVFAASVVAAAPTYSNAFGLLRGSGDIRRIRMYSGRTGESLDTIYWIEGEYIPEVMKEINYFMRDWRSDDKIQIDNRAIDIMAAAHNLMDVSEPYMLLSGYRSPATNAMLRNRSSGVARNSLHMKGQAADLRLKSRSVSQMARAAEACASGGVGRYSRSNFVHMDCGPIRHWGG